MKVWLDDARDPEQQGRKGWTWCRSFTEVTRLLMTGIVTFLSIDQDLSLEAALGTPYPNEMGGYDVLTFMDEHHCWPPEGVIIHSARPSDMPRLHQAIARHYGQIEFTAARMEASDKEEAPLLYPAWRYHRNHTVHKPVSRMVNSEEEDKALGPEWYATANVKAAIKAEDAKIAKEFEKLTEEAAVQMQETESVAIERKGKNRR